MLNNYRVVGADAEVTTYTAAGFFEVAKDADEPETGGPLTLAALSGSDGIGVEGTADELRAFLECGLDSVAAALGYHRSVVEMVVEVFGIASEEMAYSLRDYCGMLPGDFGRWKGNSRVLLSGTRVVAAATVWAQERKLAYTVSTEMRFLPDASVCRCDPHGACGCRR
jgi:hypothetical protein